MQTLTEIYADWQLTQSLAVKKPVPDVVPILALPLGSYELKRYGRLDITRELVEEIKQNFDERIWPFEAGIPLKVAPMHDVSGEAAGWVERIEITDEGGVFYVRLTSLGKKLLEEDLYRGVSAAFLREWTDPRTQRKYRNVLMHLLLTNEPALPGARILLSLSRINDSVEADVLLAEERWVVNDDALEYPVIDDVSWDADETEGAWRKWVSDKSFAEWTAAEWRRYRRRFIVYDASNPQAIGSYKLPVVFIRDGRPVVNANAVRNALARLSQTDIPDEVRERARAVLERLLERVHEQKEAQAMMEVSDVTLEEVKSLLDEKLSSLSDEIVTLKATMESLQTVVDGQLQTQRELLHEQLTQQIYERLRNMRFARCGNEVVLDANGNLVIAPEICRTYARMFAQLPDEQREQMIATLQRSPAGLVPLDANVLTGNVSAATIPTSAKEAAQLIALKIRETHQQYPDWSTNQVLAHIRETNPELVAFYEERHRELVAALK